MLKGLVPVVTLSVRRPLDLDKQILPRGQVYTIPDRCKGCKFCIEFCPEDVLEESADINPKGYHYPVVVQGKEESCVNCGFCRLVCPEFAIYTEDLRAGQ